MRLLLAFIALACVDARWGAGGGKGAAHRKREARDQVLLEEIRAQHEDITENEMLEILAERRVEADAHHHHKRRAKLHAHMNSQDYLHSGGLVGQLVSGTELLVIHVDAAARTVHFNCR